MPPKDERWWWTTGGKAGVLGLELERSQGVLDSLLEDAGYEALLDSIESQLEVLAQAETMVSTRQAEIEIAFDSFQETISQLLGPLDWLPLNMDDLVAFMPLLVACSLGSGVAWILLKRKRYVEILDTSSERSETVREIAFTLRLDAPSSRLRWSVLFCLVAGGAWIVYANLRLAGLVTEQRASGEPVLGGEMDYSLALNWGFSLVLLLGGGALSLLSLRKKV
ncbi:hypothetical protein QEH56_00655 [Pelagicoccus enzymogenes]|uniref:hypothetical protein n=1 Tax=Pelagicoccus enzymogenes TaxID=2773457 RepID=UPI00280DB847|nr:hypothetical protein [Pelagicoccus enzymogenes]MDQ8196633.1 hypothetical protein [Pelagicoccus enzymogenes]